MKFQSQTLGRLREAYREPQEPENMRMLADYYWRFLLVCALVVAALSIFYGLGQLDNVLAAIGASDQGPLPQPTLSRANLEATLSGFSARAQRYQEYRSQPPALSDPSQ